LLSQVEAPHRDALLGAAKFALDTLFDRIQAEIIQR
jgi:hypothetical protein